MERKLQRQQGGSRRTATVQRYSGFPRVAALALEIKRVPLVAQLQQSDSQQRAEYGGTRRDEPQSKR
jgi:hypothetical protein